MASIESVDKLELSGVSFDASLSLSLSRFNYYQAPVFRVSLLGALVQFAEGVAGFYQMWHSAAVGATDKFK